MAEPAIVWTKGGSYAVHLGPRCPAAARAHGLLPRVVDREKVTRLCVACEQLGQGFIPVTEGSIIRASFEHAERCKATAVSDLVAERERHAARGRMFRELEIIAEEADRA